MSLIPVMGAYDTHDHMGTHGLHNAHCLFGSTSNVFHIDVSCHDKHFICNSMIPSVQNHFEKMQCQQLSVVLYNLKASRKQ